MKQPAMGHFNFPQRRIPFKDLGGIGGVPFEQRIAEIVLKLNDMPGKKIGVMVDKGNEKKYIDAIKLEVPTLVIDFNGPLRKGVSLIRLIKP
jgi:hypothetical protein